MDNPPRLQGLIVASALGDLADGLRFESSGGERDASVSVMRVGSDPRCWDDAALEIAALLESWLEN